MNSWETDDKPPAKRSISDLDNDVFGILDLGDGPVLNCDLQFALENNGLHGVCGAHPVQ